MHGSTSSHDTGSMDPGDVDLEQMQQKAVDGLKQARGTIEEFAKENPRVAVALALGAGFVLGGGLTPRILFGAGVLAVRNFAADYARTRLQGLARGVLGAPTDDGSPTDDERRAKQTAKPARAARQP